MTRKALMLLATVALMVVAASAVAAASTSSETETHFKAQLRPVDDSGVHGTVHLFKLPSGGTQIVVLAQGLKPGKRYISLYYGNSRCANPDKDDVIGGPYTALPGGFGFTTGTADDDLDEIHAVSVRSANSFQLRACARVDH